MSLTKGELIDLLQEDSMPLDTPTSLHLECTNDDESVVSTTVDTVKYDKLFKALCINGTYTDDYI